MSEQARKAQWNVTTAQNGHTKALQAVEAAEKNLDEAQKELIKTKERLATKALALREANGRLDEIRERQRAQDHTSPKKSIDEWVKENPAHQQWYEMGKAHPGVQECQALRTKVELLYGQYCEQHDKTAEQSKLQSAAASSNNQASKGIHPQGSMFAKVAETEDAVNFLFKKF